MYRELEGLLPSEIATVSNRQLNMCHSNSTRDRTRQMCLPLEVLGRLGYDLERIVTFTPLEDVDESNPQVCIGGYVSSLP